MNNVLEDLYVLPPDPPRSRAANSVTLALKRQKDMERAFKENDWPEWMTGVKRCEDSSGQSS